MPDEYDENLIGEEELDEGQDAPEQDSEGDMIDEMMDSDPEVRGQLKEQLRQRLLNQQPQPQPQAQQPSELDEVRQELQKVDQEIDTFFEQSEENRNYEQYEKAKIRRDRLQRRELLLKEQMQEQERAVSRAPQIVESWIREKAAEDREVTKYADKIKTIANGLQPHIKADEGTLRQALQYMVEPNAYKQYVRERRQSQRKQQRTREAPSGDTYMDDDSGDEPQKQERFPNASQEEKQFLRRVGLIDEGKKEKQSGLQPTGDGGYFIPVGRGRRNQGGQ